MILSTVKLIIVDFICLSTMNIEAIEDANFLAILIYYTTFNG